jgi:amino acid adenylation domain-containing protein
MTSFRPINMSREHLISLGLHAGQELDCTPLQLELLDHKTKESFVSRSWEIAPNSPEHLQAISYTWQAVASHNEILRTALVSYGQIPDVVHKQVILKRASPVRIISQEDETTQLEDDRPAQLTITLRTNHLALTIHIPRALTDTKTLPQIQHDFQLFYDGSACQSHVPFSKYVRSIGRKDPVLATTYWREVLSGIRTAPISMLSDVRIDERSTIRLSFEDGLLASMHELIKIFGVTIRGLVHAAWAVTLSYHVQSDNNNVLFAVIGRDQTFDGHETLVGPIDQSYPLKLTIPPESSILEWIHKVEKTDLEGSAHAFLGYKEIMMLAPLIHPQTKVVLVEDPGAVEEEEYNGFPLTLVVNVSATPSLTMIHNKTTAARKIHVLLQHFLSCLHHIVKNHAVTANEVERHFERGLPSPLKHRDQDIDDAPDHSSHALGHSLLEARALETPNKVAVEGGSSYTYSTFNARTNQLADFLRRKGVQPEDVVVLLLEKSPNTLVSIFGVMKSGGAFCPLDPKSPRERNTFIVQDVKAKIAITDRSNLHFFQGLDCEAVVLEDMDLDEFSSENTILPALRPDNLVYIIYTSGSTGMPKGVLVTHASLSAAAFGMIEATGVNSNWRALWVLNYVFDGSYYDVFSVIGAGGTLVVANQSKMVNQLVDCVNDFGITHLMVTPTIASTITPAEVPGLKVLLMGGEPLVPHIIDVWAPRIPVYSVYGPTEATILITVTLVKPDSHMKNIGRPIRSVVPSILNLDSLQAVPSGEVGELCVSGIQVARGYLNRPDATRAAFLKNHDGTTVYRTGDLARWLPDGQIELLGRKDNQVKVNGFRIELDEIENAILRTGNVNACMVAAAVIQNKKQLVAFFVPKFEQTTNCELGETLLLTPDAKYDLSTVRSKLTTLPHYMMPGLWVPIAFLPLLPSGKTDRKKLVSLIEEKESSDVARYRDLDQPKKGKDDFREAETDMERVVRDAWAQVFKTSATKISATSEFYSLGGDSISAINLVNTCRRFGYELAVGDVLAYPTIRGQAKRLKHSQKNRPRQTKGFRVGGDIYKYLQDAGVNKADIEDIYPCTPGQVEFLTQGHSRDQFWQLMTVRRLPKAFDINRWIDLTTKLTAMNQSLRAMFVETGEGPAKSWVQAILKKPILDLQFVDCSTNAERQTYIDNLWQGPFQLGKPFVQYRILTTMEDGTRDLCIKLDHAMYDGTLFRIFDEQFTAMAKGLMPPKPTEFKDFVQYCQSANREGMLEFWVNLLRGRRSPYLGHIVHPKVGKFTVGKVGTNINLFAERIGVTVPIVFQTAYTLLLSKLSTGTDVLYDNLLTGRNVNIDEPQLINGNCANFLPFRSQLKLETTVKDLLHETQSLLWKTTENGLVGLRDIYSALNVDRQKEAARALFCFQPFDPPASNQDHMRWIVMALGKNTMFFNYAIMLEVFKDANGYRMKFQYDPRALSETESENLMHLYVQITERLQKEVDKSLEDFLKALA